MVNTLAPWNKPKTIIINESKHVKHEVSHGSLWKKLKESVGVTRMGYGVDATNRLPHPQSMERYAELCSDPTVSVAIDIKRDMVVPDFYFEMPEEETQKPVNDSGKGLNPDEEPDGNKPTVKPSFNSQTRKVEALVQDDPAQGNTSFNAKSTLKLNPVDDTKQVNAEHPNKKKLEEWKKNTKATKKLKQIVSTMISKGFCPVEITDDYNLKVLPPESFFIYRDKTGEVLKYTQEDNMRALNTWQGKSMDDIILFINDEDTDHPYGEADVESLVTLLDTRKELNEDMGKIIRRFSAPLIGVRTNGSAADIKQNLLDKDIDEALFLGNSAKDEVEFMVVEPDPQVKFLPYIDSVDFQIGQKLNAPLILLLKNATEASATKMLDAIDRWVQSTQNEIAEILEERIYKKICPTGPTPIHKWGAPKEVLDEMTLDQISSLTDKTISKRQAQDLIRKKGIELIEDEEFLNQKPEPSPFGNPFGQPTQEPNVDGTAKQPFPTQKKPFIPNIPVEQVEHLNDLQTALDIIESNHALHKISLVEACRWADRAITVHMKQTHGDGWKTPHDVAFQTFIHERLAPVKVSMKQVYTVEVK
jgi:hypothetical protein